MSDTTNFEGNVRSHIWARYAGKIDKVAKAARKLGTKFNLTVSAPFGRVETAMVDGIRKEVVREYVHVTIEAEVPKLAGWTLAAAIDHTTDGNLLRTVPSFTHFLPANYRTDKATCDHCRTERNRHTTYALHNTAEGRFTRVGSNCLRDFLGHADAVAIVEMAAMLAEVCSGLGPDDDDGEDYGGSGQTWYSTENLVALAFRAIRVTGAYVSGKASRDAEFAGRYTESTKNRVFRHLHPGVKTRLADVMEATDEQQAEEKLMAAAALAWIAAEIAPKGESASDFEHNLIVVSRMEAVTTKHAGIVVYIAEAYRRHLGILAERKARAESGTASAYLGEVGTKVEFDFVLTGTRTSESEYGTTYWYAGCSGNNKVTIKGSNDYFTGTKRGMQVEPVIGATYRVKATVKRNEEFRGTRSSTVTRATVVELAGSPA